MLQFWKSHALDVYPSSGGRYPIFIGKDIVPETACLLEGLQLALYIGAKAEFQRVSPVVDLIYTNKLYDKVEFSLDSFDINCLEYALDRGFSFVNDISADPNLAFLAGKYGAKYCLMHKNGDPKTMHKGFSADAV